MGAPTGGTASWLAAIVVPSVDNVPRTAICVPGLSVLTLSCVCLVNTVALDVVTLVVPRGPVSENVVPLRLPTVQAVRPRRLAGIRAPHPRPRRLGTKGPKGPNGATPPALLMRTRAAVIAVDDGAAAGTAATLTAWPGAKSENAPVTTLNIFVLLVTLTVLAPVGVLTVTVPVPLLRC